MWCRRQVENYSLTVDHFVPWKEKTTASGAHYITCDARRLGLLSATNTLVSYTMYTTLYSIVPDTFSGLTASILTVLSVLAL